MSNHEHHESERDEVQFLTPEESAIFRGLGRSSFSGKRYPSGAPITNRAIRMAEILDSKSAKPDQEVISTEE
jgi:hypothetical protein